MASTLMLNIPPNFDLNQMTTRVKDQFMSQGFSVSAAMVSKNSSRIVLDKGCGGINMLLGMGQGLDVVHRQDFPKRLVTKYL